MDLSKRFWLFGHETGWSNLLNSLIGTFDGVGELNNYYSALDNRERFDFCVFDKLTAEQTSYPSYDDEGQIILNDSENETPGVFSTTIRGKKPDSERINAILSRRYYLFSSFVGWESSGLLDLVKTSDSLDLIKREAKAAYLAQGKILRLFDVNNTSPFSEISLLSKG